MSNRELERKVALVTGGAKGVGKAICHGLARRGATVVLNYFRSPDEARETEAEISANGGTVHLIRASVAREEQVIRMMTEIEQHFGRLDILVNNASNGALVRWTK